MGKLLPRDTLYVMPDISVAVSGLLIARTAMSRSLPQSPRLENAYVIELLAARSIVDSCLMTLLECYLPLFRGWRLCHPRQRRTPASVLAMVEELASLAGNGSPLFNLVRSSGQYPETYSSGSIGRARPSGTAAFRAKSARNGQSARISVSSMRNSASCAAN